MSDEIASVDALHEVRAYVESAARLMRMPIDARRCEAVDRNLLRIAAFSADLASVELNDDIEVAGVFVP